MAGIGSMYRQKLGDMRHRISVQALTETVDAARQPVASYSNRLTDEPATYEQVTGGEYNRGRQIEAGTTAIFKVNYRSTYTIQDRIVFDGRNFGVVRIDVPTGIKRYAFLHCKEAPSG